MGEKNNSGERRNDGYQPSRRTAPGQGKGYQPRPNSARRGNNPPRMEPASPPPSRGPITSQPGTSKPASKD